MRYYLMAAVGTLSLFLQFNYARLAASLHKYFMSKDYNGLIGVQK